MSRVAARRSPPQRAVSPRAPAIHQRETPAGRRPGQGTARRQTRLIPPVTLDDAAAGLAVSPVQDPRRVGSGGARARRQPTRQPARQRCRPEQATRPSDFLAKRTHLSESSACEAEGRQSRGTGEQRGGLPSRRPAHQGCPPPVHSPRSLLKLAARIVCRVGEQKGAREKVHASRAINS